MIEESAIKGPPAKRCKKDEGLMSVFKYPKAQSFCYAGSLCIPRSR